MNFTDPTPADKEATLRTRMAEARNAAFAADVAADAYDDDIKQLQYLSVCARQEAASYRKTYRSLGADLRKLREAAP